MKRLLGIAAVAVALVAPARAQDDEAAWNAWVKDVEARQKATLACVDRAIADNNPHACDRVHACLDHNVNCAALGLKAVPPGFTPPKNPHPAPVAELPHGPVAKYPLMPGQTYIEAKVGSPAYNAAAGHPTELGNGIKFEPKYLYKYVLTTSNEEKIKEKGMLAFMSALAEFTDAILNAGYTCDSISAVRFWMFSRGVTITCNDLRYDYDLADKGGRLVVTVK
jgi:hypothetical protein